MSGPVRAVAGAALAALVGFTELVPAKASDTAPAAGVQRVALLDIEFRGDVPAGNRDAFAARLVEGLAVARFQVFSGPAVVRRLGGERADLARCRDSDCYPQVAASLDVGFLVTGSVAESNKSYEIALEIINGRSGALIGRASERCETCGIAEAAEKVGLAASSLRARLEALAETPSRVVVRSRPVGAMASIDGRRVGQTPIDVELRGGEHRLSLVLERHSRLERSFTVVSGVDEVLDLELVRMPGTFPYRGAGWAGVVAGALLVGAGAYAVSIDGDIIDCDNPDPQGHCPELRDTDWLAAILVGAGATALSFGAISLWVAAQEADGPDPTASAAGRRYGLKATGRF